MHGLGADGSDFLPIVPELGLFPKHGVRFIFPHAPIRPITINGGVPMPGWYDIHGLDLATREDERGIRESAETITHLMDAECAKGLDAQRVLLAGFSQGGAMALHCGLRYPQRLAGIMALSTYLPLADTLKEEASAANAHLPIFMAHGFADPIVAYDLGQRSRDLLRSAGHSVSWHQYPMPHSVCPAEIADIADWLKTVLGPGNPG
jgi:phospholipase/carboxylesterase